MTNPNGRLREVLDQSIHKALLASEGAEHLQIKDVIRTVNSALEAIQAANLAVVDLETHVVVPRGELTKIFNYAVAHGYRSLEVQALLTTKEPTT